MRTRVKICGITRVEDARQAAQLGADAIGLVFYQSSPRNIDIDNARLVLQSLPPFVCRVGLFVNADPVFVNQVLESLSLDMLQFHGDETADDCERFGKPYIKAVRVKPGMDIGEAVASYPGAAGILFDTFSGDTAGGSGEVFDWRLVPAAIDKPVILAGGLHPENVGNAIEAVKPYAVDVSSGVEQDKGIKDADKLAAFINEVNKKL